ARICAALDGLPLAIELAAARMRTHEPAELADRLAEQDRFLLLSRGSRTADARHQTLRAVVQWSWDLLPEAEREMAARLAVFAGGATAADAAAVCGLPDAEDLLDSLADKSLVEVAGGRYRMLETIRAFCAEQADLDPVRQAHATRFLTLAEQADPRLRGGEQLEWLARLSAEHGNLQAALRWSVESGQVTLGMRLVAAQMTYLWMRGLRVAVVAPAAALLDLAGAEPDPALGDAYVLCALATVFDPAGRPAWERHRATAERMLLDRAGVRHPVVALLWPMVVAGQSDPEVALSVLQQAGQAEDPWERAVTPLLWGYPRLSAGEFELAEQEFRTALGHFLALGDRWGSGLALDSLAWLAATRGDREVAVARVNEAIVFAEQLGAEEDQADLLCNRGDYGSDPAGRTADYERAAVLARRTGSRTDLACALRGLGDVARLSGDLERARQLYGQALELVDRRWIKALSNYARLMVGIGRIAEADGDPGAALAAYSGAVESAVTTGGISEGARGVEALARLALPDARRAAALLGAATVVRGVAVLEEPELAVRVRAILGDEAFEAEYARGAGLSKLDALRLAGVSEQVIAASPLQVMAR
ncbi:MAG: AfsR/SARP family transcriptional regulator, partial [Nonomuraea sp.]|nr:AfsR/SARP family transcriptional regulator [Nonomuraea sp.]